MTLVRPSESEKWRLARRTTRPCHGFRRLIASGPVARAAGRGPRAARLESSDEVCVLLIPPPSGSRGLGRVGLLRQHNAGALSKVCIKTSRCERAQHKPAFAL